MPRTGEKFPELQPGEPEFNDESVRDEAVANPHRVRALFQAIGACHPRWLRWSGGWSRATRSRRMEMQYEYEKAFELSVTIENDMASRTAAFTFKDMEDATFLVTSGSCAGTSPFSMGITLNLAK